MTLVRLESSKNTRVNTAKVVKKWLISATETTATTTNSSDQQTTTPANQVKEANNNATTSTKGDRLVSVHEKRLIAILTLLFAGIEYNNKKYPKINKNAGNSTRALNLTLNTPRPQKITTDTRLDRSSLLNLSQS